MTVRIHLLVAAIIAFNVTFIDPVACTTPYCCTTRSGPLPPTPTPPTPPTPGSGGFSFMNSLGNHNGPSVGNIGGNISTTGLTSSIVADNFAPIYTITTSGVYVFSKPINISATGSATLAISISASDVTIDLAGFALTYSGSTTGVSGIAIAEGMRNITIKNGSIRGFTGSGIFADGSAATSSTDVIQQVVLADLMIQGNGAGVTFLGTSSYPLKLMNITTSTISANSSYGIKYSYVNTGKLSSVTASENSNSAGNAHGVWLDNCNNIDLFAVDTERNAATGGTGYGILANACNRINFYYSNANYNSGSTGSPGAGIGFALTSTINCTIDSNNANENNIGYYDNSNPTSNSFIRNVAKRNGPFTTSTSISGASISTNYNVIVVLGAAVASAINTTQLVTFIKDASIKSPQQANAAGVPYLNYSFTD